MDSLETVMDFQGLRVRAILGGGVMERVFGPSMSFDWTDSRDSV